MKQTRHLHPQIFAVGIILLAVVSIFPARSLADGNSWIDGDVPVLAVGDQVDGPTTHADCFQATFTYWSYTKPNGSIDTIGRPIDTSTCMTENQLGFYGGSGVHDDYGLVRPGTAYAFHVYNAIGNSIAVTPIPGQPAFLTKDSSQSFNGEVTPHFYTSFPAAGSFGPVSNELGFKINQAGATLTDDAGTKLYMHAYAFSRNGQWMVMEIRALGLVRINTQTHAMQLFDPAVLSYSLGFRPQMALAISDDGNTVLKSGKDAGDAFVYDLSLCQRAGFIAGANNVNAMLGCRKRALQSSLSSQLPGFSYLSNLQFSTDGKIVSAIAARTDSTGVQLYNKVSYAVAGYQAPHLDYLALGDSFSSGEGAYNYELGTNDPENMCHLSKKSYPYLAAQALGLLSSFHSVACSGAMVDPNYYTGPQFKNLPQANVLGEWLPGYLSQSRYLSIAGATQTITVSMIGNDIGFKDKLLQCLSPLSTCYHFQDDRKSIADEIYRTFDEKLVPLYRSIRSDSGNDNVKIYVLGYPQIMDTGPNCDVNVPFSQEERQMAHELISYLNAVIKAATLKVGVQYIDVEDAFAGHLLCEDGKKAVNGLTIDNSVPSFDGKANSSFHPNTLGHELLGQTLISQSQGFTKPMPTANPNVSEPYINSPEYDALVNSMPAGGTASRFIYAGEETSDLIYRATTVPLAISKTLLPNSQYQVWFHSAPVSAGIITSDTLGRINGQITAPGGLEPGYHRLDVIGKDLSGQDLDMYKTVYVAASPDDYNGNGIPNAQDPCLLVPSAGADSDHDGVDDGCDPEIIEAPADTTPPVVTGDADRAPDSNGWYNHDVSINWTVIDPDHNGVPSSQPPSTLADREGNLAYSSEPSCDLAGNCSTGTFSLKLDKTVPDITFNVLPEQNDNGWNNTATIVEFHCADALSGIAACSGPVTVPTNGVYVITGVAVDNAGNSRSVNEIVSLDMVSPDIHNDILPTPNVAGWSNSDVTVTSSCADELSGVAACSLPVTLTTEGLGQAVIGQAIDRAGNLSWAVSAINIDKTAPTVMSFQWSNNPKATTGSATLVVNAEDNLSGIVGGEYFIGDKDPGQGQGTAMTKSGSQLVALFGANLATGVYRVTARTEDGAGNWSAPYSDYLVIYSPFSSRMTGKKTLALSSVNGDTLPYLASYGQIVVAKFGFSVGYDPRGQLLPSNDFQFAYTVGTNCNSPIRDANCHTFTLTASSIGWFTTQGVNNSQGVCGGSAFVTIDDSSQQVLFLLTGLDGERLDALATDRLTLFIYPLGSNMSSSQPLYRVGEDVLRGNIHVKT